MGFENFVNDKGRKPSPDHSLDRYPDNNQGYSPENTRWATRTQQARNMSTNRYVEFNGEIRSRADLCDELNIDPTTLQKRIDKGLDYTELVKPPIASVKIPYKGKTWTLSDLANHLGVPVSGIRYRILVSGMTVDQAVLSYRLREKNKSGISKHTEINLDGGKITLSEASQRFNIPIHVLIKRVSAGWSDEKVISPYSFRSINKHTYNGKIYSTHGLAKEIGVPGSTLVSNIKKFHPDIQKAIDLSLIHKRSERT